MGCGASSANWVEKFEEGDVKQRKTVPDVEMPDDLALPPVPPVSVSMPALSLGFKFTACFSMVMSLLDLATSLAMAVHFSSISMSSFKFVSSAVILSVFPHVLTLYEYVNSTKTQPFHLWKAVVNQLHLSSTYATLKRLTAARGDQGDARVRSLQVKIINSIAIGVPQIVVQGVHGVDSDVSALWVASMISAGLVVCEAMAEFTLREGGGVWMRWGHVGFFAAYQTPLIGGYVYLAAACSTAWRLIPLAFLVFNVLSLRAVASTTPTFVASTRPLTLTSDALTYLIGFADLNLPHPLPDTAYLLKGTFEPYAYSVFLPLATGCTSSPSKPLIYTQLGCHVAAAIVFAWLRHVKQRGKGE